MDLKRTLIGIDILKEATNRMGESEGKPDLMKVAESMMSVGWAMLGCGLFGVDEQRIHRAIQSLKGQWKSMEEDPGHTRDVLIRCSDPWGNDGVVVIGSMYSHGWEFHQRFDDHMKAVGWCEIPAFDLIEPDLEWENPEAEREPECRLCNGSGYYAERGVQGACPHCPDGRMLGAMEGSSDD